MVACEKPPPRGTRSSGQPWCQAAPVTRRGLPDLSSKRKGELCSQQCQTEVTRCGFTQPKLCQIPQHRTRSYLPELLIPSCIRSRSKSVPNQVYLQSWGFVLPLSLQDLESRRCHCHSGQHLHGKVQHPLVRVLSHSSSANPPHCSR